MKILLLPALAAGLALALSGCGESRAGLTAAPEPAPAATYKAGHGVRLTPLAREFLGLKTGGVGTLARAGKPGTPAVPADAVLRTIRGDFVYVANGEWFLRTPVSLGATDGTQVEITDGLYEDDTIVTAGVRALSLAEIQALNGGVGCADGH
jgi:hypothetical protein